MERTNKMRHQFTLSDRTLNIWGYTRKRLTEFQGNLKVRSDNDWFSKMIGIPYQSSLIQIQKLKFIKGFLADIMAQFPIQPNGP